MGARVVIADDEAIIRLDLKEILEEAGFDVVAEAGRGDEAVELIALHTPDLAILDVKMPGLDGIEAARRVVAEHDVAVLLLTAFSQRDLIEQAREAGVSAYLVKPFRKAELIPAVHAALLAAREERALAVEDDVSAVAEDKLETRRLVDQAKELLMDAHGMAEEEAFSFIQQTAMQTRARMRDVATAIVEGTLTP